MFSFLFLFIELSGSASTVQAPSERFPVFFAKQCSLVTIRAGQSQGVGWVIAVDDKLHVLTPEHVALATKKISVQCGESTWSATSIGKSATYDLALYRVTSRQTNLSSLFAWTPTMIIPPFFSGQKFNYFSPGDSLVERGRGRFLLSSGVMYPVPGHENEPESIRGLVNWFPQWNNILSPYSQMYWLRTAIRPGMSGSLLMHFTGPGEPWIAGMATKVERNGHDSAVIAIQDILRLFPALLAGQDPWRASHPELPYVEFLNGRKRIVFPSDAGAALTETCAQTAYPLTGGTWGDGGGTWGDGGKNLRTNGDYVAGTGYVTSFFHETSACPIEGLAFPDGEIAVGWKPFVTRMHRISLKAISVEDFMAPLLHWAADEKGPLLPKLKKRLVFAPSHGENDAESRAGWWNLVCSGKENFDSFGGATKRNSIFVTGNPDVNLVDLAVRPAKENPGNAIQCREKKQTYRWNLDFTLAGNPAATLQVERGAKSWTGKVVFGQCEENISADVSDPWRLNLRGQNFQAQMEISLISQSDQFLKLTLSRVSARCFPKGSAKQQKLYIFRVKSWK